MLEEEVNRKDRMRRMNVDIYERTRNEVWKLYTTRGLAREGQYCICTYDVYYHLADTKEDMITFVH
jgi:hypothetical protein